MDGWMGGRLEEEIGAHGLEGWGEGDFSDFATQCGKLLLGHRAGCSPLGAAPQASHH